MQIALRCGQTTQRRGHGIEAAFETVHAVVKGLRVKVPLGFELADARAGPPPCDAEANGTDAEALGRDDQRAKKKAGWIHVVEPSLDVCGSGGPRSGNRAAAPSSNQHWATAATCQTARAPIVT